MFDRKSKRICLTQAGEAMHSRLKLGVDMISQACDEARAFARIEMGQIKIGTLPSLALGVVTRTLGHLRKAHPGIVVSLREETSQSLVEMAASGEFDLSVCTFSKASGGLAFEHLFDDELLLVVAQDHPATRLKMSRWTALQGETLVVTPHRTSMREHLSASLAAHGVSVSEEIEVASTATALATVRAGVGVTFISHIASPELDLRGLVTKRIRDPAVRRTGIYRRIDRTPSPASEKFSELLRVEVRQTLARIGRA